MSSDFHQAVDSPLGPPPARPVYDVFLSYSREDKAVVRKVADALKQQRDDLKVFFDQWVLRPGMNWQAELEYALGNSRTFAVFIGPSGMGSWADTEREVAFDRAVNNQGCVIPVLLPGVSVSDVPLLLRKLQFCPMTAEVDQESLDLLIWGITGKNPLPERAEALRSTLATQEETDPVVVAAGKVADHLKTGNVTFFFGRTATHPESSCDITSTLLAKLGFIGKDWTELLPPADLAASYFAVKHDDDALESHVLEIVSRHDAVKPACYAALAELQKPLEARPKVRGKKEYKRLIVSSNLDILLEKALLLKGIPFTRIVQYRSSTRAQINTVRSVARLADGQLQISGPDGCAGACSPDDEVGLGALIGNCGTKTVTISSGNMVDEQGGGFVFIDGMIEPIIYKLHGSQDVEKSCTLSTEQYFDILWQSIAKKCIPDALTQIISNTPLVLVGSCIVDADFRLTYTLLRVSLEAGKDRFRYAIAPRGTGDKRDGSYMLACAAWEELEDRAMKSYGIKMLDAPGERFFTHLSQAFNARR